MPRRLAGSRLRPHQRQKTFLREWRAFRGLTLEQLAERLQEIVGQDMSTASISRIERGAQPYSQDYLENLAAVLATEVAALLGTNPATADLELLEATQKLGEKEKRQAARLIRALKESAA